MLDFLKNMFKKKKGPSSATEEPSAHKEPESFTQTCSRTDIPGLVRDPVFGGYWDSSADNCRSYVYKHWFLLEEGADLAACVEALSAWTKDHAGGACIRIRTEADLPEPEALKDLLAKCRSAGIHLIRAASEPANEFSPFMDYDDGRLYRVHEISGWGQADDAATITEYWIERLPTEEEAAEIRRKSELSDRRHNFKSYWKTIVSNGYQSPSDADRDIRTAREALAELEKNPPEKEPTYNLQCIARNRIKSQKGRVAYLEKVRAYMVRLAGLPCSLETNKDRYLWLTDFPILTASFKISECPALQGPLEELILKKAGTITAHVLYTLTGDSYEDGFERSYYRLKGSRIFDAFLNTIQEEDGPWTTNRVGDLESVSDCTDPVKGLYCTMGDIGRGSGRIHELTYDGISFILRTDGDSLKFTLIGNDPEEFVAAVKELGLPF